MPFLKPEPMNPNDPAFPVPDRRQFHDEWPNSDPDGLSKRQLFAAMAVQGMLANSKQTIDADDAEAIPRLAVWFADALLKALNK